MSTNFVGCIANIKVGNEDIGLPSFSPGVVPCCNEMAQGYITEPGAYFHSQGGYIQQAPTAPPQSVSGRPLSHNSILVEWSPPPANQQNGNIVGYKVLYIINEDGKTEVEADVMRVGVVTRAQLENLETWADYKIWVVAFTAAGDSPMSPPIIVKTHKSVPSEPRNLVADLVQQDPLVAQVSWQTPDEPNGKIESYKLYWGLKGEIYTQVILKAHQQSFFTPPIDQGETYEFRVLAKNEVDFGERAVVELVTPDGDTGQSPVARIEPRFQYVNEGAPVKFECIVTGSPTPQVEWYRGGGRSLNPRARVSAGVLTIPRAQLSDESDYYCMATNENGQTEIRTILYVKPGSLKQVTIIVRQTKYVVIAGETARLECYTEEGGERVTLFWSRQAGLPPGTQQANGVLTITNTQPIAAGRYICTGTDTDTGKISTAEALLEVNVKQTTVAPTVTMEPEKITIPMGTTGTLRCVTTGTPQPTLTWSKSREQLSPNHQVHMHTHLVQVSRIALT
ncbi:hypothetical protein DPMN_063894 [Dreissena polymorpha]|uniref:Uncharacterized protein n=1 Tax=Dreissena polymorpha TaxID=45954 RepID=A0A9D4CC80_DREPO|nr:hypothetical protein DPMN_063894 [Dreissena polymorpha]